MSLLNRKLMVLIFAMYTIVLIAGAVGIIMGQFSAPSRCDLCDENLPTKVSELQDTSDGFPSRYRAPCWCSTRRSTRVVVLADVAYCNENGGNDKCAGEAMKVMNNVAARVFVPQFNIDFDVSVETPKTTTGGLLHWDCKDPTYLKGGPRDEETQQKQLSEVADMCHKTYGEALCILFTGCPNIHVLSGKASSTVGLGQVRALCTTHSAASAMTGSSFFTTVAHEIGHVFGSEHVGPQHSDICTRHSCGLMGGGKIDSGRFEGFSHESLYQMCDHLHNVQFTCLRSDQSIPSSCLSAGGRDSVAIQVGIACIVVAVSTAVVYIFFVKRSIRNELSILATSVPNTSKRTGTQIRQKNLAQEASWTHAKRQRG